MCSRALEEEEAGVEEGVTHLPQGLSSRTPYSFRSTRHASTKHKPYKIGCEQLGECGERLCTYTKGQPEPLLTHVPSGISREDLSTWDLGP